MKDIKILKTPIIAPSLLAANRQILGLEAKKAEENGARFIHIDVMDGKFVPNVSFALEEIKELHDKHTAINDVHLMIEEPWIYFKDYKDAGADLMTFHYEAVPEKENIHSCISLIHSLDSLAGLSIKPNTDVNVLKPFIEELDLILLMSVEPGKGGQKFIPSSLERLKAIKEMISYLPKNKRPLIEIDGGINQETGKASIENGADILVAGSYLFGHEDMKERIAGLLCK